MKTSELKEKLELYVSHGHGGDEIVIGLKEPSVGKAASEKVKAAVPGFDWDQGTMILVPETPLVHYGRDRDRPMPVTRFVYRNNYSGKVRPTIHCPVCEAKLTKDMNFCPRCGQKLDMEHEKVVTL